MEALSIVTRPKRWEEIVGQDRVVRVLQGILKTGKFLPKGIILEGHYGVGKTTTGYIAAKALMCTVDPLGCGKCPSCKMFDEDPQSHPEFREIDAASYSGVEAARKVIEEASELPSLGKTRVILIDEAHSLSTDAWKTYLKPLETLDSPCTFIFATTDGTKIPKNIRSRCSVLPFSRVATDVITGLLVSIGSRLKMDYELDAMKLLARAARGHVRDAIALLDSVSSGGKVTRERVAIAVDTTYEEQALNVLLLLAGGRLKEAVATLDEMARLKVPAKAVEEVFSAYGRAIFGAEDSTPEEKRRYDAVKAHFPHPAPVTAVFIKWSASERIPVDALPLFAYEVSLINTSLPTMESKAKEVTEPEPEPAVAVAGPTLSMAARLGAKAVTK